MREKLSMDLTPDRERTFLISLPAGPYYMWRLRTRGYEETGTAQIGIRFSVHPGKATYIGRVVFEIPEKLPFNSPVTGTTWLKPRIQIENGQEVTLESIRLDRGPVVQPLITELMQPSR